MHFHIIFISNIAFFSTVMGKVRPFCRSGLESNLLRLPCCGLLFEEVCLKTHGTYHNFFDCRWKPWFFYVLLEKYFILLNQLIPLPNWYNLIVSTSRFLAIITTILYHDLALKSILGHITLLQGRWYIHMLHLPRYNSTCTCHFSIRTTVRYQYFTCWNPVCLLNFHLPFIKSYKKCCE